MTMLNYQNNIESFIFEELHTYSNVTDIGKVEKLSGYRGYYKVRFGNYRVGIKKIDNEIIFASDGKDLNPF